MRFADTSYFIALLVANDYHHRQATQLAQAWKGRTLTTDWVLIEVGNYLSGPRSRSVFWSFFRLILDDPNMSVVPASRALLEKGVDLHRARPDKEWSVTDCISINVMHEYGIQEVLSADHHFEQAGFTILLHP